MKDLVDSPLAQFVILVLAVLGGIMAVKATLSTQLNNPWLAPIAKPVLKFG